MDRNRLLIIDDEPGFGQLIKRIGEATGYAVSVTEDPRDFQRLASDWRPSVVILDLQIPGTDGIELLRELATHCRDTQVIIASGLDSKTLDAAHRLGTERGLHMAGILQKPLSAAAVRDLLARLRHSGAPPSADLSRAITHSELYLEYQPVLDRVARRISGVEALVRWRHPVRGIIQPDEFIPVAENSHELIDALTHWVVRTALTQATTWRADGIGLDLSINISAKNLRAIDFPDRLEQHCQQAGVMPSSVILELTETSAMHDSVQMREVLTRLRVKGFGLSIDDFGTGHSSLLQLQRMPFSEIKIDRSFVKQMLHDTDSRVIVEIVIDLANKLGLRSVAEGVEDEATSLALGCDALQGYHLSRPIHPDRIPGFVREYEAQIPQVAA